MKLIAKIVLVTKTKSGTEEIQPSADFEIKDAAEAASLIKRGFAYDPAENTAPLPEETPPEQ